MAVQDIPPESEVTDISTNCQREIILLNNSSGMSFPSLQHRLSVSVIIASHVLEQTHQSMFPILVFLGGQSSWDYFVLVLVLSKDFKLQVEFSQIQTYMEINQILRLQKNWKICIPLMTGWDLFKDLLIH